MSKPRILIAGAGIGGLVAALALLARGFDVALFEQTVELRELGAGVQISPNGSRVLCSLGLQPVMEAIAAVPTHWESRLFNTGQIWPADDQIAGVKRFDSPYWLLHRGDFHAALLQAVEDWAPGAIHVGARCVGFRQDASRVTLLLENSGVEHGAALIGADGVHSCTRETLFGGGHAAFTGFMAWRGVVLMDRLPAKLRQKHAATWSGPYGRVVTYPLRRGELLNFLAVIRRDDWLSESWSENGTVEECRRDLALWHEDVLTIINAIETPYKWAMYGREPLAHWSAGRASLLGDACHPTLPFLAQGVNMAIEDSMVLARCLDGYEITEALCRYEAVRLDRTSRVMRESSDSVSRMFNRRLANAEQPEVFLERQLALPSSTRYDWLYEYDAMTVPL